MCWAAAGKDPGFTPLSLLDLLRRRGKFHQDDFNRLKLAQPVELVKLKSEWIQILEEAQIFIQSRPSNEMGCLYYSKNENLFFAPNPQDKNYATHFGRPGGVLPMIMNDEIDV